MNIVQNQDDIIGVGHVRKGKNLNAYLSKFSVEGKVISEHTIGEANSFDRASSIITIDSSYWVLFNKVANNKLSIELCEFNRDIELLNSFVFTNPQYKNGLEIESISNEEIAILIDYEKSKGQYCPMVLKFNVNSLEKSFFAFDKNNYSIFPRKDNVLFGIESAGSFPDTISNFTKAASGIDVIDDVIVVLGSEDTGNSADHWAGCIDINNQLLWDTLLEKENDPGVDVLVGALKASNNNIALFGQHYNKRNNLDYNYNYILVNEQGIKLIEKTYSLGFDEHIVGFHTIGDDYLLAGYVNEEPNKTGWVGDNVNTRNLWHVLINEEGVKIQEEYIQREGFQTLVSTIKIAKDKIFGLYKQTETSNDGYYIAITKI